MVEGNISFVRLDLAITRKMHLHNIAHGVYPVLDIDLDPNLTIRKETVPDFSDLAKLLLRVGKPYGWHLRQEYHDPCSVQKITEKLQQPTSARYSFWSGNKEVGGAVVANVEPNVGKIFRKAHDEEKPLDIDPSMESKTIEIYKIGIDPEYTKRGFGKHFLSQMLTDLFNRESQPEVVYLNTRSTNHRGVISFYTGLNMNVIHARSYPTDLLAETDILPSSPLYCGPIRKIA